MRMDTSQALLLALAVLLCVLLTRLAVIVLNQAVVHFLAGNASRLLRALIVYERWSAGHQLPGTTRSQDYISKLALRSFHLHGHSVLPPKRCQQLLYSIASPVVPATQGQNYGLRFQACPLHVVVYYTKIVKLFAGDDLSTRFR